MSWTDERVDTLKKLWLDGLSASQVAKQLGSVTRNAVIAKVHRLGIATRGAATAPRPRVRPMAEVMVRPPAAVLVKRGPSTETKAGPYEQRVIQAAVSAELRAVPERRVTTTIEPAPWAVLETLDAHACRWPIGTPSSEDFGFCGRKKARG